MVLTVPMVTATTITTAADGADYQWLLLPPLPQLPMVLTVPVLLWTDVSLNQLLLHF